MDESSTSIRREEQLAHGPDGDVWRVRASDGRVLVARQILGATRGENGQLRELIRRGRGLRPPVVPFLELSGSDGDAWLLREFEVGVPLSRLALRSPLTSRQAAGIADACLDALTQLHAAGLCHGRVHAGNVFIGSDGSIRLTDGGIGGARNRRDLRALQDSDMKAAAALLHTVWPDAEFEAGRLVHERLEAGRMGDADAAREGLELLAGSLPPADNKPLADFSLAVLGVRLLDEHPPTAPDPTPAVPDPVERQAAEPWPPLDPLPWEAWLPDEPSLEGWLPEEVAPAEPEPAPAELLPEAPPPAELLPDAPPPPIVRAPSPPPPVAAPGPPPRVPAPLPVAALRWQEPVVHNATARPGVPSRPPARPRQLPRPTLPPLTLPPLGDRVRLLLGRLPAGRATLQRNRISAALAVSVALAITFVAARAITAPAQHKGVTPPPPVQQHAQAGAPSPVPGTAVLQPAAPASAGYVRQVQLLPQGACQTGGSCAFESMFNLLTPHSGAIDWQVVAVDRCTGAQSVLRSSTTTPDPSWQVVWRTDQYSLPPSDPMQLYLVTVSPWRVASSPVSVGDPGVCGPRA